MTTKTKAKKSDAPLDPVVAVYNVRVTLRGGDGRKSAPEPPGNGDIELMIESAIEDDPAVEGLTVNATVERVDR